MKKNPLNDADVDGNTIAWMADKVKNFTASFKDQYKCDCGNIVYEEEWICELKMCRECYTEHYGDLPGHDDAELRCDDR